MSKSIITTVNCKIPLFTSKTKTLFGYFALSLTALNLYGPVSLGQVAPYPPSQHISGMSFDWTTHDRRAPGSDNWPVTWSADDNQYTSWGDGGGFGGTNSNGRVSLGVARMEGGSGNYQGYNVWGGYNPENPAQFPGKSHGIISIDLSASEGQAGTLYLGRDGDGSNIAGWKFIEIYKSTDYSATWSFTGVRFDASDFIDHGFRLSTFCQFAKDYAGARDNYIYMYSVEIKDPSTWDVQVPGEIILVRVPKDGMDDKGNYQVFAGFANGDPSWSYNLEDRKPIFSDSVNGVMRVSVTYNSGLNRYILIAEHTSKSSGNIGIYDAPEPWGPWTTILFETGWASSHIEANTLTWYFSNKWTSVDGKDFVLIFSGRGSNDSWNSVEGSFIVSEDSTSPSVPTGLNTTPISDRQIDLVWLPSIDPESGISHYRIFRDGNAISQSDSTFYSDTGLNENTAYTYHVSAVNGVGLESDLSSPANATTLADTTPPAIVSVGIGGSLSEVIVNYSEPIEESSATYTNNYVIDNGIVVNSASLGNDLKTVTLSTTPHTQGLTYIITVNNVMDRAAVPNLIAPNTQVPYDVQMGNNPPPAIPAGLTITK